MKVQFQGFDLQGQKYISFSNISPLDEGQMNS